MRANPSIFVQIGAALFVGAALMVHDGVAEEPERIAVASAPIHFFDRASQATRFGSLEFLGGLELSSAEMAFGAWSSIRFLPDGRHFIGVLDTGHWLKGEIRRDVEGRLCGLDDVWLTSMRDVDGSYNQNKWSVDAESLALRGDDVIVGYEQRHRVTVFSPLSNFETALPGESLPLPFPTDELRNNGGLETLALSPAASPLGGALVAVAEKSRNRDEYRIAGILDGPLRGAFRVRTSDDFDITDGAFLPGGDLLLLQRRFNLADGVGMRIVRIPGDTLRPGAVVEGRTILEADLGYQIDNMEGLDAVRAEDGSVHLFVVSDDNHSILQRTLLLEFRLPE
ncbi:hypothetical protein DFR48_104259 [Ciceribacter lividus]|uniref:Phytase-like domain-containing protein n=2 Tax=Ciceribacter lividus TaxID=1197950 RepID=A0A6I7HPR4_9HYPH|nr:esterase-like activity of phytase family protein [Ciceribacter lividus]RCW26006.1 hypothetical protein DFR48_104259 [Ciceribacter lividus]